MLFPGLSTALFSLRVDAGPLPQPRPRCSCIPVPGPRCPSCKQPVRGHRGHAYPGGDPKDPDDPITKYHVWRRNLREVIADHWGKRRPLNGPLALSIDCVIHRPESRPTVAKWTTVDKVRQPNPRFLGGHTIVDVDAWKSGKRVPMPTKPDADRYLNAVKDAITDAGVWWDDAQSADDRVRKFYAAIDEVPHLTIRISALG